MGTAKAAAAGAVDFKGWFTVVWLTSGTIEWPQACACCRHLPETTAVAMDGQNPVAQYPICRRCLRHARIDDMAMGAAILIGALTVVGGWIAKFGFSIMARVGLQLILMFLAFILVTGAAYWLINLFISVKRSHCPDEGWPVEVYKPVDFTGMVGKDSERTDDKHLRKWYEQAAEKLGEGAFALQLRNRGYAREFIQRNGGEPSRIQTIQEAF